jgi:hypothetical protein
MENERLLTIGRLGFIAGLSAGIDLTATAFRVSMSKMDANEVAAKFMQLADDWTVLLKERLDTDAWGELENDLHHMRLENMINRARKGFWPENDAD